MDFPTTNWSLLAEATLHGDERAGAALAGRPDDLVALYGENLKRAQAGTYVYTPKGAPALAEPEALHAVLIIDLQAGTTCPAHV